MGVMYLFGDGVKKDEQTGLQYTLKAVTAQNATVLYNADICYQQRKGTITNEALSYAYLQQAADLVCRPAQKVISRFKFVVEVLL